MKRLFAIHLIVAVGVGVGVSGCATVEQPYVGQASRSIKSLSAGEMEQLQAGAGMGYARSAELNHYPGPLHALELADRLSLSTGQRASVQTLMDQHRTEARAIGARLVEAERQLDALFASGVVDQPILASSVAAAAQVQGEYRLSHLETHRRMRALLSDTQVAQYDALRGYAEGQEHKHSR